MSSAMSLRQLARPARQIRSYGRRYNSSTPSSSSSSSTTSSIAKNPQVQRAMDSAQKLASSSAATVQRVAGPLGDRVGSALGRYREPITYNFRVFLAICRQIYQVERLAPPLELSAWARAYSEIWARATSASWWKSVATTGKWAAVGIVGLEAYGIFSIGEIIGRRHLIGYKLKE